MKLLLIRMTGEARTHYGVYKRLEELGPLLGFEVVKEYFPQPDGSTYVHLPYNPEQIIRAVQNMNSTKEPAK